MGKSTQLQNTAANAMRKIRAGFIVTPGRSLDFLGEGSLVCRRIDKFGYRIGSDGPFSLESVRPCVSEGARRSWPPSLYRCQGNGLGHLGVDNGFDVRAIRRWKQRGFENRCPLHTVALRR